MFFIFVNINFTCFFCIFCSKRFFKWNFKLTPSVYSESIYFKVYLFFLFLFEFVIPLCTLSTMNILSVFKFKSLMQRHGNLTGNQTDAREAEVRFTKMILFLSFISLLTRLIDLAITIPNRIAFFSPDTFDKGTIQLLIFSKSFSFFGVNLVLALDGLVYLRMDKNIWKLIRSFTRFNRVI